MMNDLGCACLVDREYDVDGPVFSTQNIVTARKTWTCCECGDKIEIGQKYELVRGLWDRWFVFKTCLTCMRIRHDYFCSFTYEHMWEDLRNYFVEAHYNETEDDDFEWLKG